MIVALASAQMPGGMAPPKSPQEAKKMAEEMAKKMPKPPGGR